MLTFKQIEALYWVVQLGSFASAAQRLNTTQSAITKRIQELESDFDVNIFDRSGHKATLTPKGQEMVEMASELLTQRDVMLMKLKGHHTFSGILRLGITEITAMTWLPDLMAQLRILFPKLTVSPKTGMAAELLQNLLKGQLDMAFLHNEFRSPLLEQYPLDYVNFAWVGSPGMITSDRVYTPQDISEMSLIRQDMESGLNSLYDDWLHPYTAEQNLFTINSLLAMAGLTVAGFGICCLPIDYFHPLVTSRKLAVMKTSKAPPRSLYCAMYAKNANAMLYKEVATLARDVCNFSIPYGSGINA
ncbi:LysR family transcriptional regulator [Advenella mimigardefordensis]|uniref:Transcriptional regulator, LysR family n=1 Tax=Advenella mimigardefordensis (strain DSM 17166 / LMG 22922 / DPN7) TaxID=1247726 RepID=W0P7W4_ADVMD|nr:LysR family transcriptional regulator [Advenella mimigardefordensis]AHG62949.1 transcriptional regulator, LysR family [Advenella mimigardefordensis DPN7]